MKYKVLYSTQINNEFKQKDEVLEFPKGTDEGYILSLLRNKVIEESSKQDPQNVITNDESEESKSSKKAKNK